MSGITQIGQCIGCAKGPRRLDKDVCDSCLNHPKRGRKWAEMSHRIRTDPKFALEAYNKIGSERPERESAGKLLFIRMYGLPEGGTSPIQTLKIVEQLLDESGNDDEGPRKSDFRPGLRLVR